MNGVCLVIQIEVEVGFGSSSRCSHDETISTRQVVVKLRVGWGACFVIQIEVEVGFGSSP
jgi:hypothetical protein